MKWETDNRSIQQSGELYHHGIKGQQWGVRRFQNEDGTLTEEGKRRYLVGFDEAEKKADKDIERAKNQIADIEKRGWNADSAFEKSFVKQMRDEGMLNDDNLEFFKNVFKEDLAKAEADKKAARTGRELINNSKNVTYDDILKMADKADSDNKKLAEDDYTRTNKYRKEVEKIKNEFEEMKAPEYDGDEKISSLLIKIDGPLTKQNVEDEFNNLVERDKAKLLKPDVLLSTVLDFRDKSKRYLDNDRDVKTARQKCSDATDALYRDYSSDEKWEKYKKALDDQSATELWALYNWTFDNYPKEVAKYLLAD